MGEQDNSRVPAMLVVAAAVLTAGAAAFGLVADVLGVGQAGTQLLVGAAALAALVMSAVLLVHARAARQGPAGAVTAACLVLAALTVGWTARAVTGPGDVPVAAGEVAIPAGLAFQKPSPGQEVGHEVSTSGVGELGTGTAWWIAHRPVAEGRDSGTWYTFMPVQRDSTGWSAGRFTLGNDDQCGEFAIHLIAMPRAAADTLDRVDGVFALTDLPAGARSAARITVLRRCPEGR